MSLENTSRTVAVLTRGPLRNQNAHMSCRQFTAFLPMISDPPASLRRNPSSCPRPYSLPIVVRRGAALLDAPMLPPHPGQFFLRSLQQAAAPTPAAQPEGLSPHRCGPSSAAETMMPHQPTVRPTRCRTTARHSSQQQALRRQNGRHPTGRTSAAVVVSRPRKVTQRPSIWWLLSSVVARSMCAGRRRGWSCFSIPDYPLQRQNVSSYYLSLFCCVKTVPAVNDTSPTRTHVAC
jgi:hypothetical protein